VPSFAPMLAAMWARVARSSLRARLVGAAGGTLVGGAAIAASVQLQTPAACQERQSGMQTTPGAIGQERRSGMQRRASVDSHIRSGERLRVAVYGGSFNPITNAHLNCAAELIHSRLVDEVWMVPCGPRPDKPSLKTSALHRLIMCHLAVDTTFGSRFGVRVIEECTSCLRDMPSLVLMRRFKEHYPQYDFSFVVGSDNVPELHTWDAPGCPGAWEAIEDAGAKFVTECKFLVLARPGWELADEALPENFAVVGEALQRRDMHLTETHLSSSEVRDRIMRAWGSAPTDGGGVKRGADDIVRYGLRHGLERDGGEDVVGKAWYDEAEGLVPPSVLGHIVRYGLYQRE